MVIHKTMGLAGENRHWFEEHSIFVRYLIVRHGSNRMDVLIAPTGGEAALPVFSTEHAARDFLRLGAFGAGWHVRESSAGELISLLMGHIADVEMIVLDPPSRLAASGEDEDIVVERLSKKTFIGSLMEEPMLMSPR